MDLRLIIESIADGAFSEYLIDLKSIPFDWLVISDQTTAYNSGETYTDVAGMIVNEELVVLPLYVSLDSDQPWAMLLT